jgi:hypothetical protein
MRYFGTNVPCPKGTPDCAKASAGRLEPRKYLGILVTVRVTRPVSFNVRGLREFLKTNNVTD